MSKPIAAAANHAPPSALALPFVKELLDPDKPGHTRRMFWIVPSGNDHTDAIDSGKRWAVEYLTHHTETCSLSAILRDMFAKHASWDLMDDRRDYGTGFLSVIERCVLAGVRAEGDISLAVEAEIAYYASFDTINAARERATRRTAALRGHASRNATRAGSQS